MITLSEIQEGEGPVLMLNMVKFRDQRLYFEEYIPALNRVMKPLGLQGAKVTLVSKVIASIVADEDEVWDAIVLV